MPDPQGLTPVDALHNAGGRVMDDFEPTEIEHELAKLIWRTVFPWIVALIAVSMAIGFGLGYWVGSAS